MHTYEEILKLLDKYGLTRHADLVLHSLTPAIRLQSGESIDGPLPVGVSKFGGDPDLPDSIVRPERNGQPMHLLMQLRLSQLPSQFLESNGFPVSGLLWAWVDNLAFSETPPNGELLQPVPWGQNDRSAYRPSYLLDENKPLSRRPFPGYTINIEDDFHFLSSAYPEASLTPRMTLKLSQAAYQHLHDTCEPETSPLRSLLPVHLCVSQIEES